MDTALIIELVASTTVGTLEDTLTGVLPPVFTVFAGLLGLGLAIFYVRKLIQSRK